MKNLYFTCLFIAGVFFQSFAGNLDTLKIYSPEMQKEIPSIVIVPEDYDDANTQYPVLYLLHGYSGDYTTWSSIAPELQDYVNEYQTIVVTPDGGYDSWYFDSPENDSVRYESFITKTLIPTIDKKYNTYTSREQRGISGLSMGGHGALYLALKHLDLFGVVTALSGGVDIRPFPDNWGIKKQLGDKDTHPKNWEKNSVMNMADGLKKDTLAIALDIGVDDFFLDVNRALHQKLLDNDIPHDYTERPGGHTNEYWNNAIPYTLLFVSDYFSTHQPKE